MLWDIQIKQCTTCQLHLFYNDTTGDGNIMMMSNYQDVACTETDIKSVMLFTDQHLHNITVTLSLITLNLNKTVFMSTTTCVGTNVINMNQIKVYGVMPTKPIILIRVKKNCGERGYGTQLANMIQISDGNFITIIGRDVDFFEIGVISAMFMSRYSMFSILHCTFYNIETKNLLGTHQTSNTFYFWKPRILVKIQNTSFNFLRSYNSMIYLENIELLQKGPVISPILQQVMQ